MIPSWLIFRITNSALFYGGWILSIWSAAHHRAWIGVVAILFIVSGHFWFSPQPKKDFFLVIGCCLLGLILDTTYQAIGLVVFQSPNLIWPAIAPLWMISLYALLAINLDHSLAWLRGRPFLAAVFGAGGAAASYLGGERGEAIAFSTEYSLLLISLVWFVGLPALYWAEEKFT